MQKHRHGIHRRAHLLRRLTVREAEHIPVQHGRLLLSRQARERVANLGHPRRLLHRVFLERFRVQAPSSETVGGVERNGGKPRARIPRDRAAFERALRIEEGRLHHVLGILMVAQFALDESDQPGAVLSIQALNLGGRDFGGHAYSIPVRRGCRNDVHPCGSSVAFSLVTTGADLRGLMRLWPHGVSILSVDVDGDRMGVTVSSLVSLSLEPPLVGVSIGKDASCYELLRSAGRFAISLLGAEQEELARRFAAGYPPIVHWQGVPTREGKVAPLIEGALGWIEAETRTEADAGDHTFFIADVLSIEHGPSHHALVYRESTYHSV